VEREEEEAAGRDKTPSAVHDKSKKNKIKEMSKALSRGLTDYADAGKTSFSSRSKPVCLVFLTRSFFSVIPL